MYVIHPIQAALSKKRTVSKLFEIKGCHCLRTPYNAPPLTGNNDSSNENQVAQSGSLNPVKTPRLVREKG
ncbi:hypothetical protein EAH77_24500 [Ewingella americana]|uniref:Uncharacterized protein n=1 Tax=Ewingella americana TaxID=41202 RepID=A0A502FV89_9GAMM|nr:hypothetical protein EAH77_24500 [Ewingella americana]